MRWLLFIPVVYLAAVLQTSLVEMIRIGRVEPDVLAMTAVIWALTSTGSYDFLAAGLIGLLVDLISPGRIGVGLACYLLAGYAAARLRASGNARSLMAQLVAVWVGVTLLALGQTLGRWLSGATVGALPLGLGRAIGTGAYTAGAALPLLMVLGWIRQPRLRRQGEFHDL